MKRFWIILLIALAIAAGLGRYWWTHRAAQSDNSYQTAKVQRGDIQELIPATGTLEPVDSVDIGAQVAGIITAFGHDNRYPNDPTKTVDFRTEVKAGDLLAQIDPTIYQADKEQADAQLASAKASLEVAQANLEQDQAKMDDALADWNRAQALGTGQSLAQTTYDGYKATYETAKAQVDQGKAAITQAQASISEAKAQDDLAERNLQYCTITSPVNGTIIDRRVNIGQTVVSSLSAPSLFLIGTDLSHMQIWVSVNEADSSRIHEGMPVFFTLDGMDRTFKAVTGKIRWNATMTQNVVTYTVEVNADNPDGALIPYRTANVKFLANEQDNVLMVPNSALRWQPKNMDEEPTDATASTDGSGATAAPAASGASSAPAGTVAPAGTGGRGQGRKRGANGGASKSTAGTVYVLDNGQPRAVAVQLGITDDIFTAINGGDLKEGDEVITSQNSGDDNSDGSGTTNPFAPTIMRRGGGGGGRR
jgi:HlyD family secretion protein